MKILIEGYKYSKTDLKNICQGLRIEVLSGGQVETSMVGYFYNPAIDDCVFILPKVIIDPSGKVLGRYSASDIIDFENNTSLSDDRDTIEFLSKFSLYIYKALSVYAHSHPESSIVLESTIQIFGNGEYDRLHNLIDIIISFVDFYRKNQNIFVSKIATSSKGKHKINWVKTISKGSALVDRATPVYLSPIVKSKQKDLEEELIVLYMSILNYFREKYGFHDIGIDEYEIIPPEIFRAEYLDNGRGRDILLGIRHRYFSDKLLYMWNLCYAFFERDHIFNCDRNHREYLLATSFYSVYEKIIDDILGDKDLPKGIKKQNDGKILDHAFVGPGLFFDNLPKGVLYLVDSKYYNLGDKMNGDDLYKQYTYAQNIISLNVECYRHSESHRDFIKRIQPLRDDFTEGYNIIPNFFLSAKLQESPTGAVRFDFDEDHLVPLSDYPYEEQYHVDNRAFDRSTLYVFHFYINFLFIIALYASEDNLRKQIWKDKIKEKFRSFVQKGLSSRYTFFYLKPKIKDEETILQFIFSNFHAFNGKIFSTVAPNGKRLFVAAIKNNGFNEENGNFLERIDEIFTRETALCDAITTYC